MRVVEVLGSGCAKCQYVERLVREVVNEAGIEADVRHVTDYAEIAARGVLATPGLAIDGLVVIAGRIPSREQVATWLGVV
ncbi:MAG: thioredoxin family protein [Chloroflexota bacterium]|nr:MAG: thioredoxin family protein [Chloroflexota bacterium]